MRRLSTAAYCVGLAVSFAGPAPASIQGFIENRGQVDASVLYYALGSPVSIYLTQDAVVFDAKIDGRGSAVWLRFEECRQPGAVQGASQLPGLVHFIHGRDPEAWRTNVPVFESVVYEGLWPGADLRLILEGGELAYEIAGAGSDHARLSWWSWLGAEQIESIGDSERRIDAGLFTILQSTHGSGETAGFFAFVGPFGEQDPPASHVRADPSSMIWSTYLGGAANDSGYGIALDAVGDAIAVGTASSATFPTTPGAYDVTLSGSDAFITKLSSETGTMIWSTFLGGSSSEIAYAVAIDSEERPVVTGSTGSSNFPTTTGAFDRTHNGSDDVFVAVLSSAGDALVWSTYLGGSSSDMARSLDLDEAGSVFISGDTTSGNFPMTAGTYDATSNGGIDTFAAKLSNTGSTLLWSSYLGGSGTDDGWEIRVDSSSCPVISGWTGSSNFPTTAGAYDRTYNGSERDAYVAKFSASGNTLLWSTFLGGSNWDWSYGMDLDSAGNPVLVGGTMSGDFPVTPGAYDVTFALYDVFITKVASDGSALVWSTFLGGSSSEEAYDVCLGARDNPVVVGTGGSTDFPTTSSGYDDSPNGSMDAFVAMLSPEGDQLCWSSYVGGSLQDRAWSVIVDDLGKTVIAGHTESNNFPTTPGSQDQSYNGTWDAFVSKLDLGNPSSSVPGLDPAATSLFSVYPNPSPGKTAFDFALSHDGLAQIEVFDLASRLVAVPWRGAMAAGLRQITWDGSDAAGRPLPSGVYFVRLRAGAQSVTRRIVIERWQAW